MRFLLSFLLLMALAVPAYAAFDGPGHSSEATASGFKGPGASAPLNKAAQVANADDDAPIVLEGHIVSKVADDDDDYMFQDDSGQVRVDIDHKHFNGQRVTPQDTVRLHGKVDSHTFERNSVDVKRVEIIK